MQIPDAQRNMSFYPRVVVESPHILVTQPYTHTPLIGDRSALWHAMREAGMSRGAIKNTSIFLKESDKPDVEVHVRPRRRLFFHPIRFLDRKDAPKENQIIVDLGTNAQSVATQEIHPTAHAKLEDSIYYLSHILHHRKLHNELAFPLTWGAIGLTANLLIIQRFFPELHTSFTLYFLDTLRKGFSLPGLVETLPGLGAGFGSGYVVSRLRNIPHIHHYKRGEKEFLQGQKNSELLQIDLIDEKGE